MTDKQRADMLTQHCRDTVHTLTEILDNGLENESIADIRKFLEILRMEFIIIVGNPDAPEPKGVMKAQRTMSTDETFLRWMK